MTDIRHVAAGVAGIFMAIACTGGVPTLAAAGKDYTLVNAKTGKCLTIAGGSSTDNNVVAVQYKCDGDPSRQWTISPKNFKDTFQIANFKTGKCLTIAGGVSTQNNIQALQFDCDDDPSRTWRLNKMSGGLHQIRNVQTDKCLTIAGGTLAVDNLESVQFDCDQDASRLWKITPVSAGVPQAQPAAPPPPHPAPTPAASNPQCQRYANQAVHDYKQASGLPKCAAQMKAKGQLAGRWTDQFKFHYDWCLTARQEVRDAEDKQRDSLLLSCGGRSTF